MAKKKKLKVIITGIWYPVAICRYLWEALLSYPNIETWCAGPYAGREIPWANKENPRGMNLPQKYVLKPDHPTPMTQPPMVSYAMLEKHKPWEPDLWLEVNAGLQAIGKPISAPLAVVATDPHVLNYTGARERADYFFNMQTPYMKSGDIWLPYAYSPKWHAQTDKPIREREWDAALIGLQYPNRINLVNRLRQPNNHLHREGAGFKVFSKLGPSYDDAREIYHNTKIGLNWSSLQDTTARCYELMAFGIPAVMNRVPDLMKLFKDRRDFLGFDSEDEAVAIIHELLNDMDWAEEVGKQGRKAVEEHTWEARIKTIIQETGVI